MEKLWTTSLVPSLPYKYANNKAGPQYVYIKKVFWVPVVKKKKLKRINTKENRIKILNCEVGAYSWCKIKIISAWISDETNKHKC